MTTEEIKAGCGETGCERCAELKERVAALEERQRELERTVKMLRRQGGVCR